MAKKEKSKETPEAAPAKAPTIAAADAKRLLAAGKIKTSEDGCVVYPGPHLHAIVGGVTLERNVALRVVDPKGDAVTAQQLVDELVQEAAKAQPEAAPSPITALPAPEGDARAE